MDFKEIVGVVTVIMTVGAHVVYIKDILAGRTKPHIYSWFVWSLLTFVVFASLIANDAEAGSWSVGTAGAISLVVTLLALKYGTKNISRIDAVFTVAALLILPLWYITDSALTAVLVAVLIDALAFLPTIRKTWENPENETFSLYVINTIRHGLVLAAISSLVFINYIYPVMLVVMNLLVAVVIGYRIHWKKKPTR